PGAGSGTVADAAGAPGSLFVASVSNAVGTWVAHEAVTDLAGLGRIVDQAGGVSVNLVQPVEVGGQEIGPGAVAMDGTQVSSFLAGAVGLTPGERWQELLAALFRTGLRVQASGFTEVDDLGSVQAVFQTARAPRVRELP